MRISDWSSDVCSSDLRAHATDRAERRHDQRREQEDQERGGAHGGDEIAPRDRQRLANVALHASSSSASRPTMRTNAPSRLGRSLDSAAIPCPAYISPHTRVPLPPPTHVNPHGSRRC